MIAADTSTWIAFLHGADGNDVRLLDRARADQQVLMLPVALTELLSDPNATSQVADLLVGLPLMEPDTGYWRRAGESRSRGLKRRRKPRLGDALIAQSCSGIHRGPSQHRPSARSGRAAMTLQGPMLRWTDRATRWNPPPGQGVPNRVRKSRTQRE